MRDCAEQEGIKIALLSDPWPVNRSLETKRAASGRLAWRL